MRRPANAAETGYSLVVLMATVAIMLILTTAAAPTWRYLVQNDKEEELIFRGGEIADAVARYQRRHGNALPTSLEVLVEGKFLRHAYEDPMTRDGNWRLVRPGEALPGSTAGSGAGGTTTTTTTTTTRPFSTSLSGTVFGGFLGVASRSTEKSLRLFNGRSRYDEWWFLPGQPRVVGRPIGTPVGRVGLPGRVPGPSPAPGPATLPAVTSGGTANPYVVPP